MAIFTMSSRSLDIQVISQSRYLFSEAVLMDLPWSDLLKFSCRALRGVSLELNRRVKTRLMNKRDVARDVVLLSHLRSCRASSPLDIHSHRTQEIALMILNHIKSLAKNIIRHMNLVWLCLPHPFTHRCLQCPLTRPDMLTATPL